MSTRFKLILTFLFLIQIGIFGWSYYEDEEERKAYVARFSMYLENPLVVDSIDLSDWQIEELVPEFLELKNLEYINLSNNQFTEIPAILFQLPNLKTIILSHNHLKEIHLNQKNTTITHLNLSNSGLQKINSIVVLENLKVIDLSANELLEIPDLGSLSIDTILMKNNMISELSPSNFERLHNDILHLDLSNNLLTNPQNVEFLKRKCLSLDLSNNSFFFERKERYGGGNDFIINDLAYFPSTLIDTTSSLKALKMNNCNLGHINLFSKTYLEHLDIGNNKFEITCNLTNFSALKSLNISALNLDYFSYSSEYLEELNISYIYTDLTLDLPNLKTLYISDDYLMLSNVEKIFLPSLEKIYFYYDGVNKEVDLSVLQYLFPNVKIELKDRNN